MNGVIDVTTVIIDIRNQASSTHPDDRVVLYAPEVRARIGGGLVSTAPHVVELVDGQATVKNMEPGPINVRLEVLGIADTSEKFGIIPDRGEVDLDDVLALKFTWTPPVVTAALQQILDEVNAALAVVGTSVHDAIESSVAPVGAALDTKSDVGHQHQLSDVIGLQSHLTAEIAEAADHVVAGVIVRESPPGSGVYSIGGQSITVTESAPDSGLYKIGAVS